MYIAFFSVKKKISLEQRYKARLLTLFDSLTCDVYCTHKLERNTWVKLEVPPMFGTFFRIGFKNHVVHMSRAYIRLDVYRN